MSSEKHDPFYTHETIRKPTVQIPQQFLPYIVRVYGEWNNMMKRCTVCCTTGWTRNGGGGGRRNKCIGFTLVYSMKLCS